MSHRPIRSGIRIGPSGNFYNLGPIAPPPAGPLSTPQLRVLAVLIVCLLAVGFHIALQARAIRSGARSADERFLGSLVAFLVVGYVLGCRWELYRGRARKEALRESMNGEVLDN